jgi:hypothetical protein
MDYSDQKLLNRIFEIVKNNKPGNVRYKGQNKWVNKQKIYEIKQAIEKYSNEHEGGILPLTVLLPLIFGGVAAASGVAGTVASAVTSSKQAKENERHNQEMEKIAREKEGGCLCEKNEDDEENIIEKIKDAVIFLQSYGFNFI